MHDVDAAPVVTGVHHVHSLRDGSVSKFPCDVVGIGSPTVAVDLAISSGGSWSSGYDGTDPFVAPVATLLHLLCEAFRNRSGCRHV